MSYESYKCCRYDSLQMLVTALWVALGSTDKFLDYFRTLYEMMHPFSFFAADVPSMLNLF